MSIFKGWRDEVALFDLDGTTVELWGIHKKVYGELCKECYGVDGVNYLEEGYIPGKAPEDIVRTVLKNRGYDRDFIEPKIPLIEETLRKLYLPAVREGVVRVCQEFSTC